MRKFRIHSVYFRNLLIGPTAMSAVDKLILYNMRVRLNPCEFSPITDFRIWCRENKCIQ